MHRFSRRLRRAPLFCKATGQLLANLIQHGYNRVRLWEKVKRFSAPFVAQPLAPLGTSLYEGKRRRLLNQIGHWQEHCLSKDKGGCLECSGSTIVKAEAKTTACCRLPAYHSGLTCPCGRYRWCCAKLVNPPPPCRVGSLRFQELYA